MSSPQLIELRHVDYLALPPEQRVRAVAHAMARARIERSLALYQAIDWLAGRICKLVGSAAAGANPTRLQRTNP